MTAKTFDELLDLSEFDGQSLLAKYIHHGGDINNYATTWDYVAFTYSLAFDELARKAYEPGHRVGNLSIPLFFLARHSIELALKSTILEYAETDDIAPKTDGHDTLYSCGVNFQLAWRDGDVQRRTTGALSLLSRLPISKK